MRAAIREASTTSTWSYTESILSCHDLECKDLYYQNFTNSLVALHMFTSLKPNTLYSLEFLGCYDRHVICTVEDKTYCDSVNITTRPEGEKLVMNISAISNCMKCQLSATS